MALDALTMSLLAAELDERLQNSRIDKIHQPSKDEIVFHMRTKGGNLKLLLSARSGSRRICVTNEEFENPRTPPSFCMLLRKYLSGAKFVGAHGIAGERIIMLSFTATSEMGDTVNIDVAAELMGRYSNLVIINGDGKIIDAMKRVDADASSVRQLLPGLTYKLPPNRDNPRLVGRLGEVLEKVFEFPAVVDKAFMKCTQGIGPVIAREIAYNSGTSDIMANNLTRAERTAVQRRAQRVVEYYENPVWTVIYNEQNAPSEFSFMPLCQYDGLGEKTFSSVNELLVEYYARKDHAERLKQKGRDLHKLVSNLIDRTQRKQTARAEELRRSVDNEKYRIYGELLTANLYALKKGMKSVEVLTATPLQSLLM